MTIGDDVFHPAQAAGMKALQEVAPVDLSLGQGDRDTKNPAAFIRTNPDSGENGDIADDTAGAHFLVAGIHEEIFALAKGAVAPGLQFIVEQPGGAADLRR